MRALLMIVAVVALAVVSTTAEQKASSVPAKSTTTAPVTVNLNTATQAQLESLPGIGPKAAQRILEYRQKNGNFKKIEDLMNVKGIGEKAFLKLKPSLTVTQKAEAAGGADR